MPRRIALERRPTVRTYMLMGVIFAHFTGMVNVFTTMRRREARTRRVSPTLGRQMPDCARSCGRGTRTCRQLHPHIAQSQPRPTSRIMGLTPCPFPPSGARCDPIQRITADRTRAKRSETSDVGRPVPKNRVLYTIADHPSRNERVKAPFRATKARKTPIQPSNQLNSAECDASGHTKLNFLVQAPPIWTTPPPKLCPRQHLSKKNNAVRQPARRHIGNSTNQRGRMRPIPTQRKTQRGPGYFSRRAPMCRPGHAATLNRDGKRGIRLPSLGARTTAPPARRYSK